MTKHNHTGNDPDILDLLIGDRSFVKHQSKLPLQSLRRNLRKSILYGIIINIAYLVIIIMFPQWQIRSGLLLCLAFNVWLIYKSWWLSKKIDSYNAADSILHSLKAIKTDFSLWLKQQYRMAIFVYPVAVIAGFLVGGQIASPTYIDDFLQKHHAAPALLLTTLILVPVGIWLTYWMNQKYYGRYLAKIDEHILELMNDETFPVSS